MNKLRELIAAVILTFVLALSALADSPPCSIPGQTDTPPCATQIISSERDTRTATSIVSSNIELSTMTNETSLTRFATDILLSVLPLF